MLSVIYTKPYSFSCIASPALHVVTVSSPRFNIFSQCNSGPNSWYIYIHISGRSLSQLSGRKPHNPRHDGRLETRKQSRGSKCKWSRWVSNRAKYMLHPRAMVHREFGVPTHKKIQSSSASLPTLSSGRETLEGDWLSKIVIITCGVEVNIVIKPIWKLFVVFSMH